MAAKALRAVKRGVPKDAILLLVIFVAVFALWDTRALYPLKVLVVLFHEISHGVAAVLTGGSIYAIKVTPDQGGVCETIGGSRFLTLSAGYLGSMLVGAGLLLSASRSKRDREILIGLGAFLAAIAVLKMPWLSFGFVFALIAGGALVGIALKLPAGAADLTLRVIGITSCLYAILDIKDDILDRPHVVSDARMLADATGIPTLVWGVLWIGIAVYVTLWAMSRAAGVEGR